MLRPMRYQCLPFFIGLAHLLLANTLIKTDKTHKIKMKLKPIVFALFFLCAECAHAQFTGLDDFSDGAKNSTKWGPDYQKDSGLLSQTGDGVVRFSSAGASSDDFMAWPWIVGDGPFTQSWSIQADVHVPVIPLAEGYTAVGIGVAVINSSNEDHTFAASLENLRSGPEPQVFHFLSALDGGESEGEIYAPTTSTNAAVRIAWDAEAKVLSAAYDTNGAVGGYVWSVFRSFAPTNLTSWGMNGSETFKILLYGYSEVTEVTLGQNVFADNFYVLDGSIPTLTLNRNGGQVVLSWPRVALDFALQSSGTIGGGWSAVTNTTSISGEQNMVTIDASETMTFFRLRK